MDPLSIATFAAGLATFTLRASKSVYSYIAKIKSIDPTLLQLQSEVDALHSGIESVASTFQSREVVELFKSDPHSQHQSAKLLASVKPLLTDCESALQQLIEVLENTEGKSTRGWEIHRKPVKSFKLDAKASDIDLIRHQLGSYSSAMQMTLQMVNVCLIIDGNRQVGEIGVGLGRQLAGLEAQIHDVQRKVLETNNVPTVSGNSDPINDRESRQKMQTVEGYARAAWTVLSNASVYSGSDSSTVILESADVLALSNTFGSVLGLNDDGRQRVNQWVSNKKSLEEDESSDESDFEIDLFKARIAVAERKLKAKDFESAMKHFRACLTDTSALETLPLHSVIEMKLNLASACGEVKNYTKQQEVLLELVGQDMPKAQTLHIQHTLAEAYLLDSKYDLARKVAHETLKERKKLFGKRHELYHETAKLLIRICEAQKDPDSADVYRQILPPTLQILFSDTNLTLREEIIPNQPSSSNEKQNVEKFLSQNGFDINSKSTHASTLIAAAMVNYRAAVQVLLERGVDIEATDDKGRTALIYASQLGHEAVVCQLLEEGANIEAKSSIGGTALFGAISNKHIDIVRCLLNKGANTEAKDNKGNTALLWAAEKRHIDIIHCLLDNGANSEAKDNSGYTALHWAADRGHINTICCLLDRGANIETKDNRGYTALHWAADERHIDIVYYLVDRGANIEAKDNYGYTALHWAADKGHINIVCSLLNRKANIETGDNNGCTALHWAVLKDQINIVCCLLDRGANIEAKDNRGYTPLYWAGVKEHLDIVRCLISRGANPKTSR